MTPPTYLEAIEELETLLREIEDDGTDIDALTEKVKRALCLFKRVSGNSERLKRPYKLFLRR